MAHTLGLRPNEAGPSSFVTSQDFISFDDFGDDAGNNESEESEEPVPIAEDGGVRPNGNANQDSSRSNGKKRKQDDRVELEGKSKKERKREVARGTPWCEHVDFDSCVTSADV